MLYILESYRYTTVSWYFRWDSNPHHLDFESSSSANWDTEAYILEGSYFLSPQEYFKVFSSWITRNLTMHNLYTLLLYKSPTSSLWIFTAFIVLSWLGLMAALLGFEPRTTRLTADCSTVGATGPNTSHVILILFQLSYSHYVTSRIRTDIFLLQAD